MVLGAAPQFKQAVLATPSDWLLIEQVLIAGRWGFRAHRWSCVPEETILYISSLIHIIQIQK